MVSLKDSCDFLLSNDTVLKMSRPQEFNVKDKPYSYPITVFSPVNIGETLIEVGYVPLTLPKNYEFTIGDQTLTTARKIELGEEFIEVLPVTDPIFQNDTGVLEQLFQVMSIFKAANTKESLKLSDKTMVSSTWSVSREVKFGFKIFVEGNYVRDDVGLYFARLSAIGGKKVWFQLDDTIDFVEGWAWVVDFEENRINDQHKKISFTLSIDEEPFTNLVPPVFVDLLQDELAAYVFDQNGEGIIVTSDLFG